MGADALAPVPTRLSATASRPPIGARGLGPWAFAAKRCSTSLAESVNFRPVHGSYTQGMAQAPVLPRGFELPLEPRLPRVGSVDAVALEERAASLAKRSIKKDAKVFALELAVRMMDLTTLEGQDTPGKVAALASKAIRPDPADAGIPSVAAICVYPNLVPAAVARVEGTSVKVASVATAAGTRLGYTQMAATDGIPASAGSGRIALDASAATLPGVS